MNISELSEKIDAQIQEELFFRDPLAPQSFSDDLEKILDRECKKLDEKIEERLRSEFLAYGPLDSLSKDNYVTEILINHWNSIFIEREGKLEKTEAFLSAKSYSRIYPKILEEANIELTSEAPFGNGLWRDFRVHACRPPISKNTCLSLRRRSPVEIELSWFMNDEKEKLLQTWIDQKKNFLIIGSTGSGKTSLLNACLKKTKDERSVILEDTDELKIPNRKSQKLLTRPPQADRTSEVTLADLLKQSLRMRPDRLIVGEVRGGEAKDLLMALATGHSGSLSTLHADSAEQALLRLEMLVQLGAPQWSLDAVRKLIYLSLQGIVVLKNRKLHGLYKISGLEKFGFLLDETSTASKRPS